MKTRHINRAKRLFTHCRNNRSCPYCRNSRLYSSLKHRITGRELKAELRLYKINKE